MSHNPNTHSMTPEMWKRYFGQVTEERSKIIHPKKSFATMTKISGDMETYQLTKGSFFFPPIVGKPFSLDCTDDYSVFRTSVVQAIEFEDVSNILIHTMNSTYRLTIK